MKEIEDDMIKGLNEENVDLIFSRLEEHVSFVAPDETMKEMFLNMLYDAKNHIYEKIMG